MADNQDREALAGYMEVFLKHAGDWDELQYLLSQAASWEETQKPLTPAQLRTVERKVRGTVRKYLIEKCPMLGDDLERVIDEIRVEDRGHGVARIDLPKEVRVWLTPKTMVRTP